jgi:hypothetical protein
MDINIKLSDSDAFEFYVDETSDRQDQPVGLADARRWPHALKDTNTWQFHRWDMFMVDVLVRVEWHQNNLSVYQDNRRMQYSSSTLRVARFFIRPGFQDPSIAVFERQPTALDGEDHDRVQKAAEVWFASQPQYEQMVKWGLAAMRSMRDVLVLADKFDVRWWSVFEQNTEGK